MNARFSLIVAMDRARGIGREGRMPWHLPGDMRMFADLTKGEHRLDPTKPQNTVIMGRRTWESLPKSYRPLPDRRNLVLSRQANYVADGAEVVSDLNSALAKASGEVFIIGGGEIYALGLAHPGCHALLLTEVDGRFPCDAFFPEWEQEFALEERGAWQQDELDGPSYRFTRWLRVAKEQEA